MYVFYLLGFIDSQCLLFEQKNKKKNKKNMNQCIEERMQHTCCNDATVTKIVHQQAARKRTTVM